MALETTLAGYRNAALALDVRVDDLLGRLTFEEKVALMAGAAAFSLEPIPRLGVPGLRMTDGPAGVRSNAGEAATLFPAPVALAATWRPDLAYEMAAAIAQEAIALGEHVVLAPTINIVRTPLWGRNFETYSEDPVLTAQIGAAFVEGLQAQGVGASLKHYAVNNQERNRFSVSADVDERTLREVYLQAFETIVKAANPWTVMASYNKVNGAHATENPRLLTDILKGEWEYDGVVVSDWGAVHSTAPAANAGLDLEMPGPPRHWGDKLLDAARRGDIPAARIEDAARRILRVIARCGLLDEAPPPPGELRSARHQDIARRVAAEGIVLLKNEGALLPLDPAAITSLAVIGPNAGRTRLQGDGSSRVASKRRESVFDALRGRLGDRARVTFVDGVDNEPTPPAARARMFSPTRERTAEGLAVEYFSAPDFAGAPFRTGVERRLGKWISTLAPRREPFAALRWSGYFWPEKSGAHEFSVRGDGACRLTLDGRALMDGTTPGVEDSNDPTGSAALRRTVSVGLEAGRAYAFGLEYVWAPARPGAGFETVAIGVREPSGAIGEAVAAAKVADVAIVVVGSASTTESEGYDRRDIALPGPQDELVEAVLAANPRTIVVLNSGAAMAMPWISQTSAVLVLWLAGEEGPQALADILFGAASPSGRLPVTFPRRTEDNPAQGFYPGGESVRYGEGLFVGYRHYDKRGIEPLFPFGHGLTYGEFDYLGLKAPETARTDAAVTVTLTLRNRGSRAAMETAQLYVRPLSPPVERPLKELKAFAKVALGPGETDVVTLVLSPRAFAYYDDRSADWAVAAGAYEILIGASATDIRLRRTISLRERDR
jgi:beta-glucosidase